MGLVEALARDVSERTRTKGNRYFLGGAVRAIEGSDSEVVATVRGSEWYRVRLSREGDGFFASCQCPYFSDRQDFCKHIWAVVLAADAEGLLLADPVTEDAYLEPRFEDDRGTARPTTTSATTAVGGPRPHEAWQRFLQSVQQRASAPTQAYTSRYAQGELLYVFERQPDVELVPTVQVHWRTRKKNGDWGKPQPAALAPADIPILVEEQDREIM